MNGRLLLVGMVLLTSSYRLPAAVLCVTDGTQLEAALQTAASNGTADTIRLAVGEYFHPGGGTFTYAPAQGPGMNLQLSGGWSRTAAGGACGQQLPSHLALHTSITSTSGYVRLLDITAPADSSMYVRIVGLAFLGGGGAGEGNGLRIRGDQCFGHDERECGA